MIVLYAGFGSYFMLGLHGDEGQFVGGLLVLVGIVTAVLVFAFAALDFYAAFKIGKMQPIGRILGIVVACLSVLSFPLGTALGVYTLWFFFGDQGKALYNVDAAGKQYAPPPPPNSWQ